MTDDYARNERIATALREYSLERSRGRMRLPSRISFVVEFMRLDGYELTPAEIEAIEPAVTRRIIIDLASRQYMTARASGRAAGLDRVGFINAVLRDAGCSMMTGAEMAAL